MSQTPLFRIGGVYRQYAGQVALLAPCDDDGMAVAMLIGTSGEAKLKNGRRRLSDGLDLEMQAYSDHGNGCDLIPGELTFVDGEWKSASELFIVDSKTPTPIGDDYDEGDDWRTPEPTRPALDWNKPANTDRFPGFTVTSHCANEPKACGLHSPDLKQSSHQVAAVFGSAELVRR